MRKLSVEVLEAASHPDGGYAVVVLHGIESLPDGATFRIKPVDAKGNHDETAGAAWPTGEHRPRAVRRTDAGIELLIGPDIVECPALIPGTLGVIEIQTADVRGEFLWPSIRPTARPRRRHLSVVKPQPVVATKSTPAAPASKQLTAPPTPQPAMDASPPLAANGTDGLATLSSSRRAGDGGSGFVDNGLKDATTVPVTALDHAVPAAASIEQAIGANVVQLDLQRDRPSSAGHTWKPGRKQDQSPGDHSDDETPPAHTNWMTSGRRVTAIAASLAVLVSGGFLMVGNRSEIATTAVRAKQESAEAILPRAQARPRPEIAEPQELVSAQPFDPRSGRETTIVPVTVVQQQIAMSSPAQTPDPDILEREQQGPPASVVPAQPPQPNLEVTLRMRGGGFQITGDLKGFDGAKYVIESRSAGVLTMDASRFECIGDPCGRPVAAIMSLSERPSPAKPDVFRIEGSSALTAEFIPQLVRDYAASIGAAVKELPREGASGSRLRIEDTRGVELATIEVATSGTAVALASLERGTSAMALLDRPLETEAPVQSRARPQKRSKPQPSAAQPLELVVGLDGVAAVAAPATAPASISIDNLAKVLAGQITDWYDLGMPQGPIQLYLPPDGTGTMDTVMRQLLRPRGLEPSRTARRVASDTEAAEAAAKDPRGIAIVGLAARRNAKAINLEMACGLIARPSGFGVKTGEYPLIRRLSLRIPPNPALPSARGLVRLAQSGDVVAAATAARLVDQSIASLPIEEQSERMAWAVNAPAASFDMGELRQMLTDLDGATRLSVTFRFQAGTNELDQRSRADVARLASVLKEPELAGRRLILAGFTDAGGKFQANMATSQKRAAQIKSALAAAAGSGFDQRLVAAKGYGALAPVVCNGTPEGQRLNRRVEVWVAGDAPARAVAR